MQSLASNAFLGKKKTQKTKNKVKYLWSMHSRWQTDRTSNQINTNIRNYIPPRKQRNRRKSNKGCTQTKVIRKDFFKEATFKFNLFSKQKSEGVFENQIRTTSLLHRTLQLLSMSLAKPRGPRMVHSPS